MFLIYTLDVSFTTHHKMHSNNHSESVCNKPKVSNSIDDIFGIIRSMNNELWDEIKSYISKMNTYLNNNKLLNNLGKTKIIIIDKKDTLK